MLEKEAEKHDVDGWENTLVGVPKQLLEVWKENLKPLGFGLSAKPVQVAHSIGSTSLSTSWSAIETAAFTRSLVVWSMSVQMRSGQR